MPTVLREDRFRVMIYTHDHEPANVHVRCGDGVAKIVIRDELMLERIDGKMSMRDARRALQLVAANRELLLRKWEEIHGRRERA